jgi:hypothetical protein
MEGQGGRGCILLIHDLGTRWGWAVSITPRPRFTPGERTPGTHCTRLWVGPRAGLDSEAKGKILCPCRGSNLDHPVVYGRHYTDWATPAPLAVAMKTIHTITLFCIHPLPMRTEGPLVKFVTASITEPWAVSPSCQPQTGHDLFFPSVTNNTPLLSPQASKHKQCRTHNNLPKATWREYTLEQQNTVLRNHHRICVKDFNKHHMYAGIRPTPQRWDFNVLTYSAGQLTHAESSRWFQSS